MQTVISYEPVLGESQTINLLQQSGFTEVVNDTNFLLIIQTNNGSCYQIPGQVQIYPTPIGGGVFTIQGVVLYLSADPGIADLVTINQYLDDELVGMSYPYFITRNVAIADNAFGSVAMGATAANLTGGLSLTQGGGNLPEGLPVNAYFHLTGVDVSIDQEATAHGWTLTITGLQSQTLTYVGHTKTATDTQLLLRWNPGLFSANQGQNINVTASIAAVSGGTARAALNMFGFLE